MRRTVFTNGRGDRQFSIVVRIGGARRFWRFAIYSSTTYGVAQFVPLWTRDVSASTGLEATLMVRLLMRVLNGSAEAQLR